MKPTYLLVSLAIGVLAGVSYSVGVAQCPTKYPSPIVYDQITREQWMVLGWGTDPTEKPHQSGDFWCKAHIDGNGDHCSPEYRPENVRP